MTTAQQRPAISPSLSTRLATNSGAKPPLQQALEVLTVSLDDELMRYRRSRYGDDVPPVPTSQLKLRKRRRKSLNLISLKNQSAQAVATPTPPAAASAVQTTGAAIAASTPGRAAAPLPENLRLQQILGNPAVPTTQAYVPHGYDQGLMPQGSAMAPYHPRPDGYMASTEALLDSLPDDEGYDPREDIDYQPTWLEQLSTPLGLGLLLLLLVGSASFGYLVTSPEMVRRLWDNPLINAFRGSEEAAQTSEVEANGEDNIETGLQGIGPDLSESEFQDLDLGRISTLSAQDKRSSELAPFPGMAPTSGDLSNPETEQTTAETANQEPGVPRTRVESVRTEVNVPLAERQSTPTPVRSQPPTVPQSRPAPQSQATSRPQAVSRPQAAPANPGPSQAAPQTSPSATASPPPQPLGATSAVQAPSPVQNTPPAASSPPAQATAPAPISQSPPNQSNHYVVTDYTGDQSLESARQAVGDAYVRNFPDGARIQMGSFSDESAAQNMVQDLQQQGIPARVYNP
jgi:hypothetical protein